jgi:predicted transcriptional regulator of viral defense system
MSTLATSSADDVLTILSRAAARAGRPSVVLLAEDLRTADRVTGSRVRTHKLIQQLEEVGRLRPVRRGVYVIASLTGVVDVDLLALVDIVTPTPYVVTAGRALTYHGLSDQFFRKTVVLHVRKLTDWEWRGERTHYARVPSGRLWGGSDVRLAQRGRVRMATPERALLDSVAQPGWGVTLAQVTEALDIAVADDPSFAADLAAQSARYGNASVSRRLGLLISYLHGTDVAAPFLPLRGTSRGPIFLSPPGERDGPIDKDWGVRVNTDLEQLSDHRRSG